MKIRSLTHWGQCLVGQHQQGCSHDVRTRSADRSEFSHPPIQGEKSRCLQNMMNLDTIQHGQFGILNTSDTTH